MNFESYSQFHQQPVNNLYKKQIINNALFIISKDGERFNKLSTKK